jgi:hypothetical protein
MIQKCPDIEPSVWLRSDRKFENFELMGDFFIHGWSDGGIYLHAPEHGLRNTWTGIHFKLFNFFAGKLLPNENGSIFPLVAPRTVNVKREDQWNSFRIRIDWPRFQAWINGELVQDLDVETIPDLRYRLRSGYLGLSSVGYGSLGFRNLAIRELPAKESWEILFEKDEDLARNFFASDPSPGDSPASFECLNGILRTEGYGHRATRKKYRDFHLQAYIREDMDHNGGVLFRTEGKGLDGRHYEIQLQNVEDSHYPTGSLYNFRRARYPRIATGEWFLFQLIVRGQSCIVRINGENVLEYDSLDYAGEGHVELQAHRTGRWGEFKHVRIQAL